MPLPWKSPYPLVLDRDMGGGPLFENAHRIDRMNFFWGRPRKLYASRHFFKTDRGMAPNTLVLFIEYGPGDKAAWLNSQCLPGFSWEAYDLTRKAPR